MAKNRVKAYKKAKDVLKNRTYFTAKKHLYQSLSMITITQNVNWCPSVYIIYSVKMQE